MSFVYTTAIKKLRTLTKRIRIVPGGTSAGKTYGILPILIDICARTHGLEISVVSETIPHLRKGALKDFLKIMKDTGRYMDDHYNRTLLTYTFATGSYIEFFSADQEGKVRGPRRTHLYINECNNIDFETYHQLAVRTSDIIWLDFNPTHEFWAHSEYASDPDAEWLTLTYLDNEGLPEAIVKDIEKARDKAKDSEYWANWWKVYGLGQLGSLQGVVFSNWSQVDQVPEHAKLKCRGIDFGYTNDPTTTIALYEADGVWIWDEEVYRKGLPNSEHAALLKGIGVKGTDVCYADNADPKSIAELRAYGITVMPTKKGADSVMFGIGLMQEGKFLVTKRSINTIKELRNYTWMTGPSGETLNKPIDAFNHCIDAARYGYIMSKHNTGIYRIT